MFFILYGAISFGLNAYIEIANKGVLEMKDSGYEIFTYYSSIVTYMLAYKDRKIYGPAFKLTNYLSYM